MNDKPLIDHRVDEKIDEKIAVAQLPVDESKPTSTAVNTTENLASKTTMEQDRRTAGQREINLIWETTQRHIALFVVLIGCSVSAFVVISKVWQEREADPLVIAAFTLLSNICFLVAGFYFGRTNHARIGDDKDGKTVSLDDR